MKSNSIKQQRFGKLVVIDEAPPYVTPGGQAKRRVLCKCDCGTEKVVHVSSLRGGNSQSCGCGVIRARTTCQGYYGTRTHKCWENMIQRGRGHDSMRHRYFMRGIRVCKRWLVFNNFLQDMGECPSGFTIERIDNNKNYTPGNCKWVKRYAQCRNTCRSIIPITNEQPLCAKELATKHGVSYVTLKRKLKEGVPLQQAISMSPKRKFKSR